MSKMPRPVMHWRGVLVRLGRGEMPLQIVHQVLTRLQAGGAWMPQVMRYLSFVAVPLAIAFQGFDRRARRLSGGPSALCVASRPTAASYRFPAVELLAAARITIIVVPNGAAA